jgi:hypothetical protein
VGGGGEEVDKKPDLGVGFIPCIKKVQIKEKRFFISSFGYRRSKIEVCGSQPSGTYVVKLGLCIQTKKTVMLRKHMFWTTYQV